MCLGDSILLDGQSGGDSTATYEFFWWPNTDIANQNVEDPSVAPVRTTIYYVRSTSSFGCESPVDSVLVSLLPTPIADAGLNATICLGNDYQLHGSYAFTTTPAAPVGDIFFNWSPTGTLSSGTILNPIATPPASGYYTLQVYSGTCSTTDSVFITVIPNLNMDAAADTTVTCNGDSVHLSVSSVITGVTYLWSPAVSLTNPTSSNPAAFPSETTTYSVIGMMGGCTDSNAVTVTVLPTPEMGYASSQDHGCAPHEMSFIQTTANALSYSWNFGHTLPPPRLW